ncbi:MAG: methyltransferase domain-containing protein [Pirellulales bacterium]|nr:methyltransferase domain-containing protein [Pirellulales bacterium]
MQASTKFHAELSASVDETTLNHDSSAAVPEENFLGQYIPLLYHYNMLQDEDRVGAFREAIDWVVRPGMHVLELGGGTGILSSFAARCGAAVTCVERNPELVSCARRFVEENALSSQISVVQADAMTYVPKRPVDVVICEMLHVGLLREKQAQVISAFKHHYLRAHAGKLPVFLPEASVLMIQPVQQSFDFAGYYAPVPMFQAPRLDQPRTIELAELWPYASIAYDEFIPTHFQAQQKLTASAAGCVNAVRLITQNVITIDEVRQRATTWPNQCLVLPWEESFDVSPGDDLLLQFDYNAGAPIEQLSASLRVSLGS